MSVRPYEGPPVSPGTIHRPCRPQRTPNTAPKEKKIADKKKNIPTILPQKKKKKKFVCRFRATASRSDRVHQLPITILHASSHPMHADKKKKLYKIYTKFIQFFFFIQILFLDHTRILRTLHPYIHHKTPITHRYIH